MYMNSLIHNKTLLKSQFLIYFLSCSNSTEFYSRRKVEFSKSWFTDVKKKLSTIIDETPNQANLTSVTDPAHINITSNDDDDMNEEMRNHIFLEDLTNYSKLNKGYHQDLIKEFSHLYDHMKKTAHSLANIASLFEKLFTSHLELEKHVVSAMVDVSPPTSKIYSEMKTTFFKMQNSVIFNSTLTKRLFDTCVGNAAHRYEGLSDVDCI